jgi:hypothetical protein
MKYYYMTVLRFQRAKFSLDYPLGAVALKTAKLFLKIKETNRNIVDIYATVKKLLATNLSTFGLLQKFAHYD